MRQRDLGQGRAAQEGAHFDLGEEGGSLISAKDVQLRKAPGPIAVRAGDIVISAKDV